MLTLDSVLRIPAHVMFAVVEGDAVLLDTQTNKYYALDEAGARFWGLLDEGKSLREGCQVLLDEYEVETEQLEQDILELLDRLVSNGLVEVLES